MEEEQLIFDETLPWGTLPYFIQQRIYWPAMVHARNEMGWRKLHEQLFPLTYGKIKFWDCGYQLCRIINIPEYELRSVFFNLNDFNQHFQSLQCGLSVKGRLWPVERSHGGMYSRQHELPMYKISVFCYLVYNFYQGRSDSRCNFVHPLLTGYHVSHGTIGNKLLVRYLDEDNDYTRQQHIFRPIFLWNEIQATFA